MGTSVCRLTTALGISFAAFVVVTFLDKVHEVFSGQAAAEAILQCIKAVSILVGFSWEQSFDGGVEVISDMTPFNPVCVQMVCAVLVAMIVITPWRRFILAKVLKLSKERSNAEGSREAKRKDEVQSLLSAPGGQPA